MTYSIDRINVLKTAKVLAAYKRELVLQGLPLQLIDQLVISAQEVIMSLQATVPEPEFHTGDLDFTPPLLDDEEAVDDDDDEEAWKK